MARPTRERSSLWIYVTGYRIYFVFGRFFRLTAVIPPDGLKDGTGAFGRRVEANPVAGCAFATAPPQLLAF
jgi:hypothetical protein